MSGGAGRPDYWARIYGAPCQGLGPVRRAAIGSGRPAPVEAPPSIGARRRGRTPVRYGAWTSCIRGTWTSCIRGAWTSCIRGAWTAVTCASANPESSTEEATTLNTAAKPFLIFFPP